MIDAPSPDPGSRPAGEGLDPKPEKDPPGLPVPRAILRWCKWRRATLRAEERLARSTRRTRRR